MVTRFKTSTQYQDSLAWLLATCPIEELRDGKRALELATGTTISIPDSPQHWLTQGAAHVLLGEYAAAVTALEQSQKLRGQEEGITLSLKAIAAAKLNQLDAAKASLAAAKAWQKTQKPADEEVSFWTNRASAAITITPEAK
jgi:predicted TPR repeat methyltransferase